MVEVVEESVNIESRTEAEEGESGVGLALPGVIRESLCTLLEGAYLPAEKVLQSEFSFGDVFVGGEKDKGTKEA